jgi:DNA-binding transcriptional MocR family regulator
MDKRSNPELESERYHCSAEWHLFRLKHRCGVIHSRIVHLTQNGKRRFFGSQEGLAEYFGCSTKTINRAFEQLVSAGFLELTRKAAPGETNSYRLVDHATWAIKHPNQCITRIEMPWTPDESRLGKQLWAATSAEVKWMPYQVANLCSLGLTDEQVIERFDRYWAEEGQHMNPKSVPILFLRSLETGLKQAA